MKHTSILLSLAAVVCSLFTATHCARAQSTAFTYQGFLTSQGAPANGSFDLQFAVFDAVSGGAQQGVTVVSNSFGVTNGLFTVTVDPGANVFTGAARWLNVAVRPAGSATFTNVVPRQSVTAAPYAITAGTVTGPINGASIAAGTVTSTQLAAGAVTAANIASNSITANQLAAGAAVSNLNASGQTGVASGGMILSASDTNAALANAGYVKIGVTTTSDSWLQRTTVPSPVSRYSHTAVWTGGEVIVWGGFNGSAYLNDGGRYNPAADTWTPVTTVGAPSVRDSHTAVWTGSEMIVWGGETNTPGVFNDGGRYSPAADTWTAVTTNGAPSARGSHTAVWTGIEMIVWGGISNATYSTDGGRFNPASNSWTAVSTTNAPSVRRFHTAVWTGNEMVVWGGNHGGPNNNNSDGARYNPTNNSWTAVNSTNTPAARFDHTAVWTGSDMIVWAGQGSSGALSNGGRYNLATNGWTAVATNGAPAARYSHTAAWTGSEMIAWGGYSGGTNYFNDGARYSPTNNSWSAVTTNGAPSKRDLHTAVWTGNEMVVWGGNNGTNSYNDGGRYNPASNSWVPTPVSSVPAARSQHTAVWTGSEMIVWGGTLPSSPYTANDGGRYNPANNTWTLIPNTLPNTPSARTGNSAVWTGTEMIVWGGANGTNLNDGGRYNPTSNSWAVVSTNGAPAVRYGHVAVWTGSQMIIWGGATNSTYLESSNYSTIIHNGGVNDGGRYNPAADTWTAVSISNAIPGSVGQTAVWTGSEMIVFGGYFIGLISGGGWFPGGGPYTFLLGGARYNPANDSWSPVNTFGMPGGQVYHTAVWTGSEMIVFGGTGSGNVLFNSGARYNPTTGNWTAMTTDTAPAGRFYHTAVWTGSEMIVWGGQIATSPGIANDGGRYNPANNTWRTVTGSSAPPARYYHTAVWTGGDMLIWGGTTGSGAFNDTWSLTPGKVLYLYERP